MAASSTSAIHRAILKHEQDRKGSVGEILTTKDAAPVTDHSPDGESTHFMDRVVTAKHSAEQEGAKMQQSLADSKGRAQITATTAMSIVNVALLKNVIDSKAVNNRYYMVSLVLISVSLGLQVIAGLLSLMVEHIVAYMDKYGQNTLEDCLKNCCPWRCVKRKPLDEDVEMHRMDRDGLIGNEDVWDLSRKCVNERPTKRVGLCGCCPYQCSGEVYNSTESNILELFSGWESSSLEVELKSIKFEEEVRFNRNTLKTVQATIDELEEKLKDSDPEAQEAIEKDIKELNIILGSTTTKILEYQLNLRNANINELQGKYVKQLSEAIRKSRVLKLAAFWQHILNYIFYLIFILNAFITGFGIAYDPDTSAATMANVPISGYSGWFSANSNNDTLSSVNDTLPN